MSQSTIELDKQELLDRITAFEDHNTNEEFMSILLSAIVQSQLSGRAELCWFPCDASKKYTDYFRESLSFSLCVACGISVAIIRRWIRVGNPHYSVRADAVRVITLYMRRDTCREAWERECYRHRRGVAPPGDGS